MSVVFLILSLFVSPALADHLVILHTNDTHSNIDIDANGAGGVLPRKAIIDSVRKAEKNVMLIDAGDMVQGSLYFKKFHGDVEYPIFNMMDYDIRILGNHEFDNGLDQLASYWKNVKGARLSANYDFKGTPAEGLFEPYIIKKIDGRKIGFMGINVDPESLISKFNYEGMKFLPIIETANSTAEFLKNKKKCDLVVAVTHIGYTNSLGQTGDVDLAKASKDIDIIIGGHSHTFVDPETPEKTPYWIENSIGQPVLVAQTGKYGRNVGQIDIDLDQLHKQRNDFITYSYIPVTDRFPQSSYDERIVKFLQPYKEKVDSINNHVIGKSLYNMKNERNGGLANWTGDMALEFCRVLADSLRGAGEDVGLVDMAIMNVGGIRQNMPEGDITEGQILSTFPFSNRYVIAKIKGSDIIQAMNVAAKKGGEAISGNVRVLTGEGDQTVRVIIDGREMDPDKVYTVGSIDYIAQGNDGLVTLANGEIVYEDPCELSVRVLDYVKTKTALGLPVAPDQTGRFQKAVDLSR